MNNTPQDVLKFWRDAGPEKWFKKDDTFDAAIADNFIPLYGRACRGELDDWAKEPDAATALILIFDQFSRNLYRNDARAFAQDGRCLRIVHDMMASGADRKVPEDIAPFVYMPLMHSENLCDQDHAVRLFHTRMPETVKDMIDHARAHRQIIRDFGRFPFRNDALSRKTTKAEAAFMSEGG